MRFIPYVAMLLAVAPTTVNAQIWDNCKYQAERSLSLDAAGARLLDITAGAGSLKIAGKAGLTGIRARGHACASHKDLLDKIQLEGHRSGTTLVVAANKREGNYSLRMNNYARLDVVIEVPARMAADIEDGSGEIDLSGLGAVDIEDGSGAIVANDIASATIDDGSGEIRLVDVRGPVSIDDGSGEISLQNIAGAIDIDDGSGEITVRNTRGNVHISDSSGSIRVADVAGDFVVSDDGSGDIDYDNVRGRVDVPRRHRR